MKKRLRKKKHKGEFDWRGFQVDCTFDPPLSEEGVDTLLDAFIAFVESRNLGTSGGTGPDNASHYVMKWVPCLQHRGFTGHLRYRHVHCTEDDRVAVEAWLKPRCKTVLIGPLQSSYR